MITSIGEAIQGTQSLYSKGMKSKDSRLSSRHIYSELLNARSLIFKQMSAKGQATNKWVYQVIPCVELEKAPIHDCPCIPNNGCFILRSKHILPVAMSGLSDMLITSMTTMDGGTTIDSTTFEAVKSMNGRKYTFAKPGFYIRNQRAYVVNRLTLKAVTINGLFDDPIQVKQFPSICGPCEDCECIDPMDYEFPADKDTLGKIQRVAADRLLILFPQMKEDKNANATDDAAMGNQMIHQPQDRPE